MSQTTEIGLEILSEVARISTSTLDLDEILARTIQIVKSKLRIDACALYLIDYEDGETRLKLKGSSGLPEDGAARVYLPLGKGVTGWVAQHKEPLALNEALQDPRFVYFPEIEEERFQSMLSVPLLFQDECIGVINVHTFEKRFFNPMEITLLQTLSSQIAGCIRNALEYRKSQSLLRERTLLYEISQAVQAATKLEHRLWLLLTGITLGEGGGFNRAILFQLDERQSRLSGAMGLGPDSPEDAGRIWSELKTHAGEEFHWVVSQADWDQYKHSAFHRLVTGLEFPFRPQDNLLAESLLHNRQEIVRDAAAHPLVPEALRSALEVNEFAVFPLVAHEVPLGVILVDNRYNRHPINESNLKLFARLASQVTWVMENNRLFKKLLESNRELLSTKELLVQSEKLAALGELSAEVAHEIKNPLVSIGGFARRLRDKLEGLSRETPSEEDLQAAQNYATIILNEVERLETLLRNILTFTREDTLDLKPRALPELIEEVLGFFETEIRQQGVILEKDFSRNPGPVWMDAEKIKQVLINVVFNALESMPEGGRLKLSTGVLDGDQGPLAQIRVEDNGGGIPPEVFQNIFNPFFTTKEGGTGLGLAISQRIMQGHQGDIRVENNVNQGVTVTLYFPLQNADNSTKT